MLRLIDTTPQYMRDAIKARIRQDCAIEGATGRVVSLATVSRPGGLFTYQVVIQDDSRGFFLEVDSHVCT